MRRLLFDPSRPRQIKTFDLDGVARRVALRWSDRNTAWYLDVYDMEGGAVQLGARVAPNAVLVADLNRAEPEEEHGGVLVALGRSDYTRYDLCTESGINIYYVTRVEYDDMIASMIESEDLLVT